MESIKTPTHLWIVGILSLLWNGFGGYDYVMSQTRNMDYLASMSPSPEAAQQLLDWMDGFPAWATFFWALGVWGGVAGSVLLLARSRHAVTAFIVSLVGMIVGLGYQFVGPPAPDWATEGMFAIMPFIILLVGIGLLYYAHQQKKKGVLR